MSKEPRTLSIFHDLMDTEYSWRIAELSNFRNNIPRESNNIQKSMIRAGITLLYAHWEGFIKTVANLYYQFVSFQTHNICDFNSSFIAIILSEEANNLIDTKKVTYRTIVFDRIVSRLNEKAYLPSISPIKTSNLKYEIFEDVCMLLNVDIARFSLKEEFINKQLLDKRNTIAHGKYLNVEYKHFDEIYRTTTNLLREFKDEVTNSAALKKYLRDAQEKI